MRRAVCVCHVCVVVETIALSQDSVLVCVSMYVHVQYTVCVCLSLHICRRFCVSQRERGKMERNQKDRRRERQSEGCKREREKATAETEIERNRLDEASRRGTERMN